MRHFILDTNILIKYQGHLPSRDLTSNRFIIPEPVLAEFLPLTKQHPKFKESFSCVKENLLNDFEIIYISSDIPLKEISEKTSPRYKHNLSSILSIYIAKNYQDNIANADNKVFFVTDDLKVSEYAKNELSLNVINANDLSDMLRDETEHKEPIEDISMTEIYRISQLESEVSALKKVIVNINSQVKNLNISYKTSYVNENRIQELKNIKSQDFDLSKLIQLCEELNRCNVNECFFATAMIVRSIIDHIPPIFNHPSFGQVANNYSGSTKSFKDHAQKLNDLLRKISDSYLHTHIRKKESLPQKNQVDFSPSLDFVLGEIVRILK